MSPRFDQKPVFSQRSTLIKHVTSMSYKLEPAICSRDTGQRIAWFDRCQLVITWCHISKKYTVNQGCMSLSTYYGRHVARLPRHRRRAHAPTRHTADHDNMRKSIHMGMGLPLAALRAAGAQLWHGLLCTSLILDIHVMINWHLPKQGIRWLALRDHIAGSSLYKAFHFGWSDLLWILRWQCLSCAGPCS